MTGSMTPEAFLNEHELTSRLRRLGVSDQQLEAMRFSWSNQGWSFEQWTFTWLEGTPEEAIPLIKAYCALKWVILEDPPESADKDAARRLVNVTEAAPIHALGLQFRHSQARRASKPRGKIFDDKTLRQVIAEFASGRERRYETARELWPHLYAELDRLSLKPEETRAIPKFHDAMPMPTTIATAAGKSPSASSPTSFPNVGDRPNQVSRASLEPRSNFRPRFAPISARQQEERSMPKPTPRGLLIEYLPISQLRLNQRNPRHHSNRQIKQLAHSIEVFGFNVPVLTDRLNNVIAGHGRLLACELSGLDHVPVIRLEHLTLAQAKAFSIADNRLTEISTWDDRLLAGILEELAALDLDFSIEATGFSMGEIDLRIETLSAKPEEEADPADELPEPLDHPAVSAASDLWILGRHRLLCGNALDAAAYQTLMDGRAAQVVFTDPPYNVPIEGHVSGNGAIRHREFAMAAGEMTVGQFTHFLTTFMYLAARHSENGSLHYVCIDWRHLLELLTAGNQVYSKLQNLCVWVKPNGGMGSLYRSRHELVLVFKNGTAPHRNNVELGQHGRNRTNVWDYASPSSFGREGEEGRLSALHPTVKPVALVADAILDCSARGDVVLDPFLGSGTTLIAAERTGRSCHGIEIDPLYVDTIVRRWQRHSGNVAIHAGSGRSFDEIAAERKAGHV